MKITVEIDCTPAEARDFLGLPDVKPIQEEMMSDMRERMMSAAHAMDPAEILRSWMSGTGGFDRSQDLFALMTGAKRGK
ncbi:DUF6489 family protein [Amaricoccus sp. W119]|uniref:DUF6489 family protein n=1 Tax=Amaricoccus sp. W119 TaxID=3391833 RepID=UPI0039A4D35A